jgi:excisionase family DNA binding protein
MEKQILETLKSIDNSLKSIDKKLGNMSEKANTPERAKPIMTTKEVSEYLGITIKEVIRLQDEGSLKSLKSFRNPLKFCREKVEEFLKKEA